jgi:hypothetical protein
VTGTTVVIGAGPYGLSVALFQDYCDWFRRRAVQRLDPACAAAVRRRPDGFRVELSDGRAIDAARVVVATGVARFAHVPGFAAGLPAGLAMHTLALRDPDARAGPLPRLDPCFESSVPGLHFVGALAEHDFGPLCRFVAGAALAAHQVGRRAAEAAA